MAKAAGVTLPKYPWHIVNLWWGLNRPVQHFTSLEMDVTMIDIPSSYNLYISPCGRRTSMSCNSTAAYRPTSTAGPIRTAAERVFRQRRIFSRWSSDRTTLLSLDHVAAGRRPTAWSRALGTRASLHSVRQPFAWSQRHVHLQRDQGRDRAGGGQACDSVSLPRAAARADSPKCHEIGSLRFEGDDFTYWPRHAAFVEVYSTAQNPALRHPESERRLRPPAAQWPVRRLHAPQGLLSQPRPGRSRLRVGESRR